MSDSTENAGFDAESQESLLVENRHHQAAAAAEGGVCVSEAAAESSSTSIHAKKKLMRYILVIRSTLVFKSRAHRYAAEFTSSSSTADYASICICDDEGSGSAAASADSLDRAHSSPPGNIELQRQLQREKVSEIVKTKNSQLLGDFGGVRGVAEALNTDLERGMISTSQPTSPCKPNQLSQLLLTSFTTFLESCNNLTVFLLSCAAVLSLGFGIKEDGLQIMGLFNGGVLLATVFMIVVCTTIRKCWEKWSTNKSQLGRKFEVQIVRGGVTRSVGEGDIEVGDIALLRRGDQVPADGLFVCSGDESLQLDDGSINEDNPFMFYGSKVVNGAGRMLVTSTGMDTVWGEMMSQAANEDCNFECYLKKLFVCLHILGLLISILIIVVLFLRYRAGKLDDERRYRPDSKGEPTQLKTLVEALKAIITGTKGTARVVTTLLSVSLMGIMEGIPLVISVSILVWNRKTLANMALEGDSFATFNIPRLTTICTDIYGGMTAHDVEIHKLYVGEGFVSESSTVASQVVEALCDVIAAPCLLSATDDDRGDPNLESLLSWAESELGMNRSLIEQSKMNSPFNQHVHVLMEKNGNTSSGHLLHCKGHPDHILSICKHHYGIDGQIREIDGERKRQLERDIEHMLADQEAEVIAYACKHVRDLADEVSDQPNDLAFLAMISLRKTKMADTKLAVARLKGERNIRIILVSGDDVSVLKPIGEKCGLLSNDNNSDIDLQVLTGEEFRELTDDGRVKVIEKICIMGNCTPDDKFLLIKCLKETGQVVALVAQRTVDAPALKLADIGLTYGTASSEIARNCSDFTVVDGNCCLSLLVNVIESGRCFLGNIRKFIQLQLILAISSLLINFTATVVLGDAPITAVQLFWLNLVAALVGGLALLTGPPPLSAVAALPVQSSEKLITRDMWRNIGVQVCYQTGAFVALQHKGQEILGTSGVRVKLIIYNAFFLCQMFSIFIAREPTNKNIFSGLFHNNCRWFWVALLLFAICQALFAVADKYLGSTPGLHWKSWGVCLLIAFVSWPLDLLAKMLATLSE